MPKRSSKPRDLNRQASEIVREATDEQPEAPAPDPPKDPAAVSLGRRGGLKGGRARAEKLTPEQRRKQARRAAQARWSRKRP